MALIGKIISGGQTGADRGAIEAALKAGFAYGGLVPKGRLAEDGCVPEKFTAMEEADTEDYRFRTRWNAEHSDATLILAFSDQLEGGTQRTRQYCMNARKPVFVDNPNTPATDGDQLAVFNWIAKVCKKNGGRPLVINVAGPRESKEPGLEAAVERYVSSLIAKDNAKVYVPSAKSSFVTKCLLLFAACLISGMAHAANVVWGGGRIEYYAPGENWGHSPGVQIYDWWVIADDGAICVNVFMDVQCSTSKADFTFLSKSDSDRFQRMSSGDVIDASTMVGAGMIDDTMRVDPYNTVFVAYETEVYTDIYTSYNVYGWVEFGFSSSEGLVVVNGAMDLEGGAIVVGGGAIPEPSSALLLILGCAVLALRRQRQLFQSHSSVEEDEL